MSGTNSGTGCLGCLGMFVVLTVLGSFVFGGGVLMRVGSAVLSLGKPVNHDQILTNYWADLERQAEQADKAVQTFQTHVQQGTCSKTYDQATDAFKRDVTQADFVMLCGTIQSKFGPVVSIQRSDWWGSPGEDAGSHYVLLRYTVKRRKATVYETFTWRVKNNQSQLLNYQIFPGPIPSPSFS
jgi:hypothetical protein